MRPRLIVFAFLVVNLSAQIAWEPRVFYDGNIFPSKLIASANLERKQGPASIGHGEGSIDVQINGASPGQHFKLLIECSNPRICLPTEYSFDAAPASPFTVNPLMNWNYEGLAEFKTQQPANFTFKLYSNDSLLGTRTLVARVRSVNDCIYSFMTPEGRGVDYAFLFGAFVDELNPNIDHYLREMLNTRLITSVSGYQQGPEGVLKQVFALWTVLQRRGFRYSSVSSILQAGDKVHSQFVRSLNDSMKTSQSNCVDGTILFASILEKMGIHTGLVLIPGHCFLMFYLDDSRTRPTALETTMMGVVDLSQYPEAGTLSALLNNTNKTDISYRTFNAAISQGTKEFNEALANRTLRVVDIAAVRKRGINPIPFRN